MPKFAVLIGDLVESRQIEDRAEAQRELRRLLEEKNQKYGESSFAPLQLVRGDEFEGGFTDGAVPYQVFMEVARALHPIRLRGGIGFGAVDTDFGPSVTGMDGTAFHRAREAIEKAQENRTDLAVKSGEESADKVINTILSLLFVLKEDWTKRQLEIINYYRERNDSTHKSVADHFGISQPAVSRIFERAQFEVILEAEEVVKDQLSERVNRGD